MVKTRQDIRVVQYSVVCALLAERFGDTPLAMFCFVYLWFTFRKINRGFFMEPLGLALLEKLPVSSSKTSFTAWSHPWQYQRVCP